VDLPDQVGVPVKEGAVDSGGRGMLLGLISCPAAVAAAMALMTRVRRRAESA